MGFRNNPFSSFERIIKNAPEHVESWTVKGTFLAGYYGHMLSEKEERCEGLTELILSKIGNQFLQIAHPKVFESYPYPFTITGNRIEDVKYQKLTEENTDAFLSSLIFTVVRSTTLSLVSVGIALRASKRN